MSDETASGSTAPLVFISYEWTVQDWVKMLADRLLDAGINVRVDLYDLKPGQDKHKYMESMVRDTVISKVLMICTKAYKVKADDRKGGVGDETQIITPEMYKDADQRRFVPIIREKDENGNAYTPIYMAPRIYLDFSDDARFEERFETLVREIFGKPLHEKPRLGSSPPSYITDDSKPPSPTRHRFSAATSAIRGGKPHVAGLARDYFDSVVEVLAGMRVTAQDGDTTADLRQRILDSLDSFLPLRDEFVDFVKVVCRYGTDKALYEAIQQFYFRAAKFLGGPSTPGEGLLCTDNYRFVIGELFLYTIATLVANARHAETQILLGAAYQVASGALNQRVSSYNVLEPYFEDIENWDPRPRMTGRETPVLSLIRQRATRSDIAVPELIDTDFLLHVRDLLHPTRWDFDGWYGRLSLNNRQQLLYMRTPPSWAHAIAHNDFMRLCLILNVADKAELIARFEATCEKLNKSNNPMGKDKCEFYRSLMNIPALDSA